MIPLHRAKSKPPRVNMLFNSSFKLELEVTHILLNFKLTVGIRTLSVRRRTSDCENLQSVHVLSVDGEQINKKRVGCYGKKLVKEPQNFKYYLRMVEDSFQ